MADPDDTLTGIPLASQAFADSVLGPAVTGWLLQLMFAGFAMSMLIKYVQTELYKSDSRRMNWLLYWVIGLLLAHSGIAFYSIWHYSTWQIRDAQTLFSDTVADSLSTLPIGLLGVTVQTYLSMRAGVLFSRTWTKSIYYGAVAITTIASFVGAMMYLVIAVRTRNGDYDYKNATITFSDSIGLFLWGCAAADILISATLCTMLWRALGHHTESRPVLRRLMAVAIQSASFTAIFALIGAILSHSFGDESLDAGACITFLQPLSSFYAISFLISLSSRDKTQRIINDARARFAGGKPQNYDGNAKLFPSPMGAGGDPFMRLPDETIRMTPLGRHVPEFAVQFDGLVDERPGQGIVHPQR